ncbi:hypothetical protein WJX75_000234 [Coccomyxa subellipsoidea]|uniref:Uncharacterized protein n=1 Tax=Coccomyxa subellipsoidea TaxID=248742 RepID=A0ABR2YV55_9CHLO
MHPAVHCSKGALVYHSDPSKEERWFVAFGNALMFRRIFYMHFGALATRTDPGKGARARIPDAEEKAFLVANGACSKNASGDGVKLVDVAAIAAGFRAAYMKNPGSTRTPVGPVDALEILENVSTAPRLTQSEALAIGGAR